MDKHEYFLLVKHLFDMGYTPEELGIQSAEDVYDIDFEREDDFDSNYETDCH